MKIQKNVIDKGLIIAELGNIHHLSALSFIPDEIGIQSRNHLLCTHRFLVKYKTLDRRQAVCGIDVSVQFDRPCKVLTTAIENTLAGRKTPIIQHGYHHERMSFPDCFIEVFFILCLGLNEKGQMVFIDGCKLFIAAALGQGRAFEGKVCFTDRIETSMNRQLEHFQGSKRSIGRTETIVVELDLPATQRHIGFRPCTIYVKSVHDCRNQNFIVIEQGKGSPLPDTTH
ncbi:hypothetical protein DSECCO2_587210 [anaerobic digester metagenome]